MRKILFTILTTCSLLAAFSQSANISIIPAPASLTPGQGFFTLPATIGIETQSQESKDLQEWLKRVDVKKLSEVK